MRRGVAGPRGGGLYLSRVQQTRLLDAAAEVVVEEGVGRISARRVSARAGMSTKTFYDLFADGEDCFLAVFDRAVEELAAVAGPAWAGEDEWVERVRGALVVLLGCLERDPALARVVFVEALGAGPRVLGRRAEVLDRVAGFLDQGRVDASAAAGLPSLVAAGVVGAAFSIVHARLVEESPGSLMELVGPVMATVVLPYRGRECSASELARPVPELPALADDAPEDDSAGSQARGASRSRTQGAWRTDRQSTGSPIGQHASDRGRRDAPPIAPVRLTERTCAVLAAVGELGGGNNRQVAAGSGASEPQISRLLPRLAEHGLVENRGGGRGGHAKAWWLTASGAEFLRSGRPLAGAEGEKSSSDRAGRSGGRGASRSRTQRAWRATHASERGRRGAPPIGPLMAGMDVAEDQRVRILRAAAVAVDEHGYGAVTVAHITARAKISRRTFYELFVDREQCLLAVMAHIEEQLTSELQAADLDGLSWRERVRMGLWTVLRFFDREPVFARFCVVESARGDDRMASHRAELLARIAGVFAEGARESVLDGECSPLVAEGIAGAVVSVLNTRLSSSSRRRGRSGTSPIVVLHGEMMGLIVLPYLGPEVARDERFRPLPTAPASGQKLERGIREQRRAA
jgi:AcrR family transcriptional regulator